VRWSPGLRALFGLSGNRSGSLAAHLAVVPATDRARVAQALDEAGRTGEPFSLEHDVVVADGSLRRVAHSGEGVLAPDGTPIAVVGVVNPSPALARARPTPLDRLAAAAEIAHFGNWEWDVARDRLTWSAELYRIFGVQPGSVSETLEGLLSLVHGRDRERLRAEMLDVSTGTRELDTAASIVRPDGSLRRLHVLGQAIGVDDSGVERVAGICHDVTEQLEAAEARRRAEARFRGAFAYAPIGVAVVEITPNGPGRVIEANQALGRMAGRPAYELVGTDLPSFLLPDDPLAATDGWADLLARRRDVMAVAARCLRPGSEEIDTELQVSLVRERETGGYAIVQAEDVTHRRRYEERLRHLAEHDPLTGLPNRKRFMEALEHHIGLAHRFGGAGAVIVIDLDHFKAVNDQLGQHTGDELVARAAEALISRLDTTDVAARLGGDEFAVLLPHALSDDAMRSARALLGAIRAATTLDVVDAPRRVTASAGVSLYDGRSYVHIDDVMVEADVALHEAKLAGRDRAELFTRDEHKEQHRRTRQSGYERIRTALDQDGFLLYWQPIMDLASGEIDGYEVLLRLAASEGPLPPGAFMRAAEESSLIGQVDRWVVAHALDELVRTAEAKDLRVHINLSGASVADPEMGELVESELRRTGIEPTRIAFEVTETVAIHNMQRAARFARRLQDLGCTIALDDFGAGFGSFYYLKHLPFDIVKIDGDFVRTLSTSRVDQLTVQSIATLARGLGKQTVAEFVEDAAALDLLRGFGVDMAQGYHVGRPMPMPNGNGVAANGALSA
jgi:diguanylate cyclase (GGDEF)-like protein/PAS domain S-box-containing protein